MSANNTLSIHPMPLKSAICSDGAGYFSLAIKLNAASVGQKQNVKRNPLALSLVLDRSGSMGGGRLTAAKAAILSLVDRLTDQDRVGLIVYDDEVNEIFPITAVGEVRSRFREVLQSVRTGGCTNLFGGWELGMKRLNEASGGNLTKRVILLSDGQANEGLTDIEEICARVKDAANKQISTSTIGLGIDFNEELMTAMAEKGRGQASYGERVEDFQEAFDAEIGLLQATVFSHVELELCDSMGLAQCLNNYEQIGPNRWRMPNLAENSSAMICLNFYMEAALRANAEGCLLNLKARALDVENRFVEAATTLSPLPVLDRTAFDALQADNNVAQLFREQQAVQLQNRIHAAMRADDHPTAKRLLDELETLVGDDAWLMGSAKRIRELLDQGEHVLMMKEVRYKSSRMSSRIRSLDEDVMSYSMMSESAKPAFLRRKISEGRKSGD